MQCKKAERDRRQRKKGIQGTANFDPSSILAVVMLWRHSLAGRGRVAGESVRPVPDVRLCARLFECLREAVSAFKARHCMAVKG